MFLKIFLNGFLIKRTPFPLYCIKLSNLVMIIKM